ncbi:hypothetical protein [Pseudomonas sp. R5(2019)]|uniref:hypothetical protein n=1 Tax=Pseudomonas sp. R5(2019) TaxID=2697566 RepID=UPI0014127ECE|nr:hypothetical protein [Pseudomonas sp. R5(2019)]NBA95160.1 hypothetical protein [Pseudomonas sp. R5(2019)]
MFFWLALQLQHDLARRSEQAPCHRFFILEKVAINLFLERFGPFVMGRATVWNGNGETLRDKKAQPSGAIIATWTPVYVQPTCNNVRNGSAH